jgi:DNA polymerase (family 10)
VQDSRQVALALDEIAALMEFAGAKRFQTQAYERGARIVESVADDLGSYVEQDRLVEIDGIGPSLSRQIQELWNTGESALLARLRSEHPPGTAELMQVEGLTPKRIRALHASLAIDSVEALREACVARRVRSVKGFGEKTEERILDAIDRWLGRTGEPAQVLRSEALQLVERLERQLLNARLASKVEAVGALRRGEETVRELELLVVAEPETMHEGPHAFPRWHGWTANIAWRCLPVASRSTCALPASNLTVWARFSARARPSTLPSLRRARASAGSHSRPRACAARA